MPYLVGVIQIKRILAVLMLYSSVWADDPATISLGGPRKVTATIITNDEHYEIKVSLIPVRSFDPGMNRRISQEKAHLFAREALLRHLGGNQGQSAVFKNVEVINAGNVDNRFVLKIRVPRQGVRLTDLAESKPAIPPTKEVGRRSLLKAKDDHQETLEVVAKSLSDELPVVGVDVEKFYNAIADAEQIGINRLNALQKEIKQDILLLGLEREELLEMVAGEEKRFLDLLRQRVEQANAEERK